MVTLSQTNRLTLNAGSSLQAPSGLAKQDVFNSARGTRLGQRASQSSNRNGTRASWGFALRSSNPQVIGTSGSSTSSTANVRQMHSGGIWEFFNNGAFRFTPNGLGVVARTDLFPLTGSYRINGSTLSFSGSRSSGNSNARNFASLTGAISLRNGSAVVDQRTVSSMAANINNTPFGQTTDRTVRLSMRMVRIA